MVALEVNKILQATPLKLSGKKGMCEMTIYVRMRTAVVFYMCIYE